MCIFEGIAGGGEGGRGGGGWRRWELGMVVSTRYYTRFMYQELGEVGMLETVDPGIWKGGGVLALFQNWT